MNDEVRIWQQFSTSTISDALDRLKIPGQCFGIRPLDPAFSIIGRAFTVRMAPAGDAKGTVGDYIDDVPKGYAVVIDNGGSTRQCGEICSPLLRIAKASPERRSTECAATP